MAQIYALIDPRDHSMRYIGKANDAMKRLQTHMRDCVRRDTPVYRWIRKLVGLGQSPEILVLSECEGWQAEERRLIARARERGYRLLNVADGGDEPHCPVEVRRSNGRKNSLARESDPVKKSIHRFLQRAGQVFRDIEKFADQERILRNREALKKLKMMAKVDPSGFYQMLVEKGRA